MPRATITADPLIIGAGRQKPLAAVRQQPGSVVCGLACMATATGMNLASLTSLLFKGTTPRGLNTRTMVNLLRRLGVGTKGRTRLEQLKWDWWQRPLTRLIKIQHQRKSKNWHWVIFDGVTRLVIDPEGNKNQNELRGRATSSIVLYGGPLELNNVRTRYHAGSNGPQPTSTRGAKVQTAELSDDARAGRGIDQYGAIAGKDTI